MKRLICLMFAVIVLINATYNKPDTEMNYLKGNRILMPLNTRLDTATVFLKAGDSVYTKKFKFANRAWKVGKVAIFDTNIVDQDTLNIGTGATGGVHILQRLCFIAGNLFGFDTTDSDTVCDVCGDSLNSPFINAEGLSADSLIMAACDTTHMKRASFEGDSMWISRGYFVSVPDPGILFDYKIKANSGFGSTVKKVIMMIWSFEGVPTWQDR